MREKCCKNCFYFRSEINDGYREVYHCDLYNLHNGEVSHPEDQFCGDENWNMKVICINDKTVNTNKKINGITLGKIYDVIRIGQENRVINIIDDNGYSTWYNDTALKPLNEFREEKLKELGI